MKDLLIKNIDDELHRRFKLYCMANNTTMTNSLKGFMKASTAKTVISTPTAETILTGETIVTLVTEEEPDEEE